MISLLRNRASLLIQVKARTYFPVSLGDPRSLHDSSVSPLIEKRHYFFVRHSDARLDWKEKVLSATDATGHTFVVRSARVSSFAHKLSSIIGVVSFADRRTNIPRRP